MFCTCCLSSFGKTHEETQGQTREAQAPHGRPVCPQQQRVRSSCLRSRTHPESGEGIAAAGPSCTGVVGVDPGVSKLVIPTPLVRITQHFIRLKICRGCRGGGETEEAEGWGGTRYHAITEQNLSDCGRHAPLCIRTSRGRNADNTPCRVLCSQ